MAIQSEEENTNCLHQLNQQLDEVYMQIAGYLNQHIGIRRLTEVHNQLRYVFNAKDIVDCARKHSELQDAQGLLNQYYIEQLLRLSNVLLTTRNGRVVLRTWSLLSDAILHEDGSDLAPGETDRIIQKGRLMQDGRKEFLHPDR